MMAVVAMAFMVMVIFINALPFGMAITFILLMFVSIALVWWLFERKNKSWRIVAIILAVLYIVIYGLGIYYLSSTYAAFSKISAKETSGTVAAKPVDVTQDAFNIYITGIDQWNKEKGMDLERSDVNMIVTVSPQSRTILLTSIPRDSYVKLHTAQQMDKLTHTGVYGVDETLNTVEDWLDIDINYYCKVNFTAVVKIINAMEGVRVNSPKAFKSSISKYYYEKGENLLSGREALYFARERKAFDGEDSQRVSNQQIVVKAMLDKLFSSTTLLFKYGKLLDVAADDFETNMSVDEMSSLVKMQLADLGAWNIKTQKIEGKYEMDYVASLTQEEKFQVYKTFPTSVEKAIKKINKTKKPSAAEIAKATAARQTASAIGFIRNIFSNERKEIN